MQIKHNFKALRGNDDGVILVFFAIALAVLLGIVAMSFDMGRIASTQSELQSFGDSVALAAAGELDGKSDAITRANGAAAALITDSQVYGSGGQALGGAADYTLDFYRTLPTSDTANLAAGLTTDPKLAAYARVVVVPKNVTFTFGAAFQALTQSAAPNNRVGAVAVAGFTQYACDITPLMFCIPSPTFKADENIGDMILLRSGGNGAAWGPGDFGFLDLETAGLDSAGPCAGLNGAQQTRCLIGASGALTQCFSQRGVDTEPGQKVGIENSAYNIRFDIFSGSLNNRRNDANYPAAPNVIKGMTPGSNGNGNGNGNGGGGNACNPQPTTTSASLPRDNCFYTSSCASGGRFGDGNWSNATTGRPYYETTNYGATGRYPTAVTRFAYYKAEIAAAGGGASTARILPAPRGETGRPQCTSHQSPDPDRRVVIAAGINCDPATGTEINGRETNVPVNEFVRLFLTEPVGVGSGNSFDIYVEVVGTAQSNGAGLTGVFHDVVQLYR